MAPDVVEIAPAVSEISSDDSTVISLVQTLLGSHTTWTDNKAYLSTHRKSEPKIEYISD